MLEISLPYGKEALKARLPVERLVFDGRMEPLAALPDFAAALRAALERPIGCAPLAELVAAAKSVLILIEDNTRNTPVDKILPVLLDVLEQAGVAPAKIEILTAPGTHRVMSAAELEAKIGPGISRRVKVSQHDFRDTASLAQLAPVKVGRSLIPVQVNRKALAADIVIGIGDIVPHCDAPDFRAGPRSSSRGSAAMHDRRNPRRRALLEEIPLGAVDNPCRLGMEEVARRVGLSFIVNVVKNFQNEVVRIVAGDFVAAHREGVRTSRLSFGVAVPEPADIVLVSSYPCDIDYWQARGDHLGLLRGEKGGVIIFAAPCPEGLEHNHPRLREWLARDYAAACAKAAASSPEDTSEDLVAADLAILNARIREKAEIFLVSDGLTDPEDIRVLGYTRFESLQAAVDEAFRRIPGASAGILPRGATACRSSAAGAAGRG
jgi:nickel-dependent lactate racemase